MVAAVDVAPLAVVVAHTEATALLPCAAATVAPLVATHPDVEATVVVTVAVVLLLAAATTHTEQRPTRTKIDTACALRSRRLQTLRGKSPCRTKIPTAGRKQQRGSAVCVLGEKGYETRSFAVFHYYYHSCVCYSS